MSIVPERNETKERLHTAIDVMDNNEASKLWDIITDSFKEAAAWAMIPSEEPDEIGLAMLDAIETDPECHVFYTSEEVKRELGMLQDEYRAS